MEKECKIVQDLLPAYIDNILSEESKVYVEEHLKKCEECKKIYDEMNFDIQKEAVKNTEIIQTIKKYKRKIIALKTFLIIVILAIIITIISIIGFRFYVVKNALIKNINYDASGNFRIEEYDESIERYNVHTTTYYGDGKMKKLRGEEVLEYWEGSQHYYINNENKTYYIVDEDINENNDIYIPILVVDGMEKLIKDNKISNIEILKFILNKDVTIQEEGFRTKEYYVIKNMLNGERIYFDKDTFWADKVETRSSFGTKEYRVLTNSVSWYDVTKPDLTNYTLINN